MPVAELPGSQQSHMRLGPGFPSLWVGPLASLPVLRCQGARLHILHSPVPSLPSTHGRGLLVRPLLAEVKAVSSETESHVRCWKGKSAEQLTPMQ